MRGPRSESGTTNPPACLIQRNDGFVRSRSYGANSADDRNCLMTAQDHPYPRVEFLSLKVFLQTSHRSMPNLVMMPGHADDLVNYILSLKRN